MADTMRGKMQTQPLARVARDDGPDRRVGEHAALPAHPKGAARWPPEHPRANDIEIGDEVRD